VELGVGRRRRTTARSRSGAGARPRTAAAATATPAEPTAGAAPTAHHLLSVGDDFVALCHLSVVALSASVRVEGAIKSKENGVRAVERDAETERRVRRSESARGGRLQSTRATGASVRRVCGEHATTVNRTERRGEWNRQKTQAKEREAQTANSNEACDMGKIFLAQRTSVQSTSIL
jgi:hypothetical protein